ncbi:MAG: MFS transporter [Rubrivivax sp.]
MALPDWLASRNGRLAAFFLLYVTEGLPLGFVVTAVATQLRRMGVGPADIGALVAAFYLPWAFKWATGPLVDVFRSQRFGHRRAWILGTQAMMASTVLMLAAVPLPQALTLFIALLLVHNAFGATQDVAIDALAVDRLHADERGLAAGLMFAGAQVGQAVGGAGVLWVSGFIGFQWGYVLVPAAIASVSLAVVWPLREPPAPRIEGGWSAVRLEVKGFVEQAFRAFLGSRPAFVGVLYALLPNGAMALGLALQNNLAVELGFDDDAVALLALVTTITGAVGMVAGGWVSDRLGRRRMLAIFLVLMSVPVAWLAWQLHLHGYGLPRPPGSARVPELVRPLWIAAVSYAMAMGLMYGPRTAVFMDLTHPRVAATQFTAYMAMLNVAIAFAATWQGLVVEAWGYVVTLLIDAAVGLVSIPLLALLRPVSPQAGSDAAAPRRARLACTLLGLGCAAFTPWWWWRDPQGALVSLGNTVFTLLFVCSALLLVAATLLQPMGHAARRALRALALLLLVMYARRWAPADAATLQGLIAAAPLAGALALAALSRQAWTALSAPDAPAPAAVTGS